jgi:hypothetical protein
VHTHPVHAKLKGRNIVVIIAKLLRPNPRLPLYVHASTLDVKGSTEKAANILIDDLVNGPEDLRCARSLVMSGWANRSATRHSSRSQYSPLCRPGDHGSGPLEEKS